MTGVKADKPALCNTTLKPCDKTCFKISSLVIIPNTLKKNL